MRIKVILEGQEHILDSADVQVYKEHGGTWVDALEETEPTFADVAAIKRARREILKMQGYE